MKSILIVVVALCLFNLNQSLLKKKVKRHSSSFEPHGVNRLQRRQVPQLSEVKHSEQGWVVENNAGGTVKVHIQLPTKKVNDLIQLMDYDTEKQCIFKEGFVANIVKANCQSVWAKPAYILLTPQSFKLCEKAEGSACFSEVKLCQISHIHTPTDWQSSPCFQVIGKEKGMDGQGVVLAQLCASDYAAAIGWQHAILSYHRCREGMYQHRK